MMDKAGPPRSQLTWSRAAKRGVPPLAMDAPWNCRKWMVGAAFRLWRVVTSNSVAYLTPAHRGSRRGFWPRLATAAGQVSSASTIRSFTKSSRRILKSCGPPSVLISNCDELAGEHRTFGPAPGGASRAGTARRSAPLMPYVAPHARLAGRRPGRLAPEPVRRRGQPRLGAGRGVGFSARYPDQVAASSASAA